jgi:hypothetical protein
MEQHRISSLSPPQKLTVVRDGTVGVSSKGNSESGKHTNGRQSNSISASEGVATKDGGYKNDDGGDTRNHANSNSLDNDSGGTTATEMRK